MRYASSTPHLMHGNRRMRLSKAMIVGIVLTLLNSSPNAISKWALFSILLPTRFFCNAFRVLLILNLFYAIATALKKKKKSAMKTKVRNLKKLPFNTAILLKTKILLKFERTDFKAYQNRAKF